ncbi:MAG: YeeE/YedE family protein, partial [Pseudomonadales bacterium]|nr:YeeE/YedE family protein [Pseudomonadales bacterium]
TTQHLLAGLLMGLGAVIASGGNDTQLLLALPALSPAGVVVIISMLIGIFLGRELMKKFISP